MLTKATVVGAGAMGTMVAQILAANHVRVAWLARSKERADELRMRGVNVRYMPGVRLDPLVSPTHDVQAAMAFTELIISAVPCQYLRESWTRLKDAIPDSTPICSVTKGIEAASLRRPLEIIREIVPPSCPIAVLSGPCIAPEVVRCLPATVVVACERGGVAQRVQQALSTSWFRIYTNADVLGVELAGALKNIIALAAGILDGLRAGNNAKGALLTRGLAEIARLGIALGARRDTFMGLAGVGDLVTTCVSPLGRNRAAGERIGRGTPVEQVLRESTSVIEGIPTTQAALRLAQRAAVEMPITQAVSDVFSGTKTPLLAITDLMNRPLRAEDSEF